MTMPLVAPAEIAGVTVHRHVLDREASRLASIAKRLGLRLQYQLREKPIDWMPDDEFQRTAAIYASIVMGLLKEQRERAKLVPGKGAHMGLTDEEYAAELAAIRSEALRKLPALEIQKELLRRSGETET